MRPPTFARADVQAIEEFAKGVQAKKPFGPIPCSFTVGGTAIPTRAVEPPSPPLTGVLGPEELRAHYSLTTKTIEFKCHGVTLDQGKESYEHIVRVTGHEALHILQYSHFTQLQIDRAGCLNKAACASDNDYAAYVACDVELPAHSMMIALALRACKPDDFDVAAPITYIYHYIERKLGISQQKASVLCQLVKEARLMHSQF